MSNTSTLSLDPLQYHKFVPLDFASISDVPDSHVWPLQEFDDFKQDHHLAVPIVDLKDHDFLDLILDACEKWGIFQVVNHGVPIELLEQVESEAQRLFSLPTHEKLKALRSSQSPGVGYGVAPSSQHSLKCIWHEGFTMKDNTSTIDCIEKLWPHDYNRFCDAMENYRANMKAITTRLIGLILLSFDTPKEKIDWLYSPNVVGAIQLNSYPPCPDPSKTLGLGPHTDSTLLTILHQTPNISTSINTQSGLQVFKQDVGWVSVYPIRGALVVNVGDLLHILSNGRFVSALHRVKAHLSHHRFAIAYFSRPPLDYDLTATCKALEDSSEGTHVYRSVNVGDYIKLRAKNFDNVLSLLKI